MGTKHRRVDLCPIANEHATCGKTHSLISMECDGSWMTVDQFERTALKWQETESRVLEKAVEVSSEGRGLKTGLKCIPKDKKPIVLGLLKRKLMEEESNPFCKQIKTMVGFSKKELDSDEQTTHRTEHHQQQMEITTHNSKKKVVHETARIDKDHLSANALKRINLMSDVKRIPVIVEGFSIDQDPPRSSKSEFQYLYEMFFHKRCGETHN